MVCERSQIVWSLPQPVCLSSQTSLPLSPSEASKERETERKRERKRGARGIMGSPRALHSLPQSSNIFIALQPPLKNPGNLCGGESIPSLYCLRLFATIYVHMSRDRKQPSSFEEPENKIKFFCIQCGEDNLTLGIGVGVGL